MEDFSFSCSADEQVCQSWEGAEPGSQPKLARGNIPCHGHHAQFTSGGWLGGRNSVFFHEFVIFPRVLRSLLMDWLCNQSSDSKKNCIVCSLFCLIFIIISFVVLLNCLYLNPRVLLFPIPLPIPLGGREEWTSSCMVPGASLNHDSEIQKNIPQRLKEMKMSSL